MRDPCGKDLFLFTYTKNMRKYLENVLCSKKIKSLEEHIKVLQDKLAEKQQVINKTNAYWKKQMAELKRKKSTK